MVVPTRCASEAPAYFQSFRRLCLSSFFDELAQPLGGLLQSL